MTPWTVACQAPLVQGILQARILQWAAISLSGDLPYPGIEPGSPALQADSLPYGTPDEAEVFNHVYMCPYTHIHMILYIIYIDYIYTY